jgi:hypothetical protein
VYIPVETVLRRVEGLRENDGGGESNYDKLRAHM